MARQAQLVAWTLMVCGTLVLAADTAEQAAPELPVAGWHGGQVSLEDFKGQVTAVVFFDDSRG